MKKPEITEGEWSVKKYHALGQWSDEDPGEILIEQEDGIAICSVDPYGTGGNIEMGKSNAKAIKAVPDMIDALIEAKIDLKTFVNEFAGTGAYLEETKEVIRKIESALKKAGCE